jgi:NAD(P)-dependent dehydrogenase (short-subunit alcohol dehydrogenase family)
MEIDMRVTVITGCDSGIGASLCRIFSRQGYSVIITYLNKNPFETDPSVMAVRLDLRNNIQIEQFAETVNRYCNQGHTLEYFINNAGVAMGGPFENIPMDVYRTVFEINFFGLISITQKILPSLIKSCGRLVINGSMAGRVALPFLSPYVSTKFALEGWCDSVRRELNPFGVKTILLEPGGIATPIWSNALRQDYSFADKKYETSMQSFKKNFIAGGSRGMNVDTAAKQIFNIITKKRPGARYLVARSRFISFLETLIPDRLLDRIVIRMFSMQYGKKTGWHKPVI